jgi:hypothetical protein
MAYTRKIYDDKAYKHELTESTQPGKYSLLDESTYNNETCFQETPEIHAGVGQFKISKNKDMVNVESDLFNLIRKDSKDPKSKYPSIKKEYKNGPKLETCKKTDLSRKYPLLEAPVFKREQEIHVPRFESLAINPQDMNRIRANTYIGLNTRLYSRDNFKAKKPMLNDKNNNKSLPEEKKEWVSPLDDLMNYFGELKKNDKEDKKKNSKKENFQGCGSCQL